MGDQYEELLERRYGELARRVGELELQLANGLARLRVVEEEGRRWRVEGVGPDPGVVRGASRRRLRVLPGGQGSEE